MGTPGVIAHRGLSGLAPENTMAAFRRALDIGVDMIELDVLLSADDQLVVFHDETLDRTTDVDTPTASKLILPSINPLDVAYMTGLALMEVNDLSTLPKQYRDMRNKYIKDATERKEKEEDKVIGFRKPRS